MLGITNSINDLRGGTSNSAKTPSRLELSITCSGIMPQSRLRSRVAVQVGVYQQKLHAVSQHRRATDAPYVALGQTEVINGQQPATASFLQRIPVEYYFEEVQPMRFDAYDVEDSTKNMEEQTYIGSATLTLAEIVAAPKRELTKPLIRAGTSPTAQSGALKKAGTITIVVRSHLGISSSSPVPLLCLPVHCISVRSLVEEPRERVDDPFSQGQ